MRYSNINSSPLVFIVYAFCLVGIALTAGCRKFLEAPKPVGQIAGSEAYISDNSIASVVSGNFSLMQSSAVFSHNTCVGLQAGLYADVRVMSIEKSFEYVISMLFRGALPWTCGYSGPSSCFIPVAYRATGRLLQRSGETDVIVAGRSPNVCAMWCCFCGQ